MSVCVCVSGKQCSADFKGAFCGHQCSSHLMEECSRSYRIPTGLGTNLRWFTLSYSIKAANFNNNEVFEIMKKVMTKLRISIHFISEFTSAFCLPGRCIYICTVRFKKYLLEILNIHFLHGCKEPLQPQVLSIYQSKHDHKQEADFVQAMRRLPCTSTT